MSNVFGNMSTEGMEEQGDSLGGFQTYDSDIYLADVKAFYAGKARESNSQNVTVILTLPGNKEYRETIYVTNKNGENFYKNDNDKKVILPGYQLADSIAMMTTGKPLNQLTAEEKVVNVWDPEESKELPKAVQMFTEVLGNKIYAGIVKEIVSKTVKGQDGKYHPTDETREQNRIDKFFHSESKQTMTEAKDGLEAGFFDKWLEANKGQVKNKAKGNKGTNGKAAPQSNAGSGEKKTSLFGNKN